MGSSRPRPERLAEKLLYIRTALGLSQTEMLRCLGADELIAYTQISRYETGAREPPLMLLLQYARAANVSVEALIDDGLDLPDALPARVKSEGVMARRGAVGARRRGKGGAAK